jgi:hypothetical protein
MGAERAGRRQDGRVASRGIDLPELQTPARAQPVVTAFGRFCSTLHPTGARSGIRTDLSKLCSSTVFQKLPSQAVFTEINEFHSELFDDVVDSPTVRTDGLRSWCVQIANGSRGACDLDAP